MLLPFHVFSLFLFFTVFFFSSPNLSNYNIFFLPSILYLPLTGCYSFLWNHNITNLCSLQKHQYSKNIGIPLTIYKVLMIYNFNDRFQTSYCLCLIMIYNLPLMWEHDLQLSMFFFTCHFLDKCPSKLKKKVTWEHIVFGFDVFVEWVI